MIATFLLWSAARSPDPRKPVHAASSDCYWCGSPLTMGCRVREVCSTSFTDHDQAAVPTSLWLCRACTWTMTGRPPDTLRLWSIVYREDRKAAPSHPAAPRLGPRLHLTNKANVSEIDSVLRTPPIGPWVCSVADSGQIHVAPFARVNTGAGAWCVRFERLDVLSSPDEYTRVASVMIELYAAGYSKEDIAGEPSPSKLYRSGVELWREHDRFLRRYRGGALFELALFLLRKP